METQVKQCNDKDFGFELCKKLNQSRDSAKAILGVTSVKGDVYNDLNVISHLSVVEKNEKREPKKIVITASSHDHGFLYFIWCADGEKPEHQGPLDYYYSHSGAKRNVDLITIKSVTIPKEF